MKAILVFLLALVSFSAAAQSFTLTPAGFTSETEQSKAYVVLQVEGQSQQELYQRTLAYLHTLYRSPKDVLSPLENESITVRGFAERAIPRNSFHVFDMDYSLTLQFRDGQVRINAPSFALTAFSDKPQELRLVSSNALDGSVLGIYSPKHQLKSPKAKEALEAFFQDYIAQLEAALVAPASQEAW